MRKVELIDVRTGKRKTVPRKLADPLVQMGIFEYPAVIAAPAAPAPASPHAPEDVEGLTYWELRRRVTDAGLQPDGNKKEDLLRALRYHTRDMRAG